MFIGFEIKYIFMYSFSIYVIRQILIISTQIHFSEYYSKSENPSEKIYSTLIEPFLGNFLYIFNIYQIYISY